MKRISTAIISAILIMPALGVAAPHYGVTISDAVVDKNPPHLRGYQFMFNYDPQRFQWRKFNVYFDGGFSRFWVNTPHNSAVNIYSIAPVVRYAFKKRGPISPYLDISIGFSWLSSTRMANKNYGIHFAFQDRLGVGAQFGATEQFSLGMHAVHYSNAHLAKRNSGITIPVVLDVGYRFQ